MDNFNMEYTGSIIKQLREEKGESQEELAKAINAPNRETVARWENASRDLKREHIIAIANHFNVSSDYLLGLSQSRPVDVDAQSIYKTIGLSEKSIDNLKFFLDSGFSFENGNLAKVAIYNRIFEHPMFRAILDNIIQLVRVADAYKVTLLVKNRDAKGEIECRWGDEYAFSKYVAEESFKFLCNCLIEDITGLDPNKLCMIVNDFEFYMRGENNAKHNPTSE